jgi:hypothetical protein
MNALYAKIFNLDLPIDIQLKLFDQTILPILTYNCESWGFENNDIIEVVHTDFLRKITNSKKSTPIYMLYGELGRHPLDIIIKTRMIKYWAKILRSDDSKLTRICYENMLLSVPNFKWINYVKKILDQTANTFIWNN